MKRRELIKSLVVSGIVIGSGGLMFRAKEEKKLHIVGVGSGGTTMMAEFYERGVNARFSCITDNLVLAQRREIGQVCYHRGSELRGEYMRETNGIPLSDRMKALFDGEDCHVVLVGLGSSVGTGAISDLLAYLSTEQKDFLVVCSLPFAMEGRRRRIYALAKKAEIEKFNHVQIVDLQTIRDIEEDMSVRAAFAMANSRIFEVVTQNLSGKYKFNECLV